MNSFARRLLVILPLAAGLLSASAMAQNESEPNDVRMEANGPYPFGTTIRGTTYSGDHDFFVFTLAQPLSVSIAVWGLQPGVCSSNIDPVINLYNAVGSLLATVDDTNGSACPQMNPSNTPVMATLTPGTYYVDVYSLATYQTQPYILETTTSVRPEPLSEKFTYQGELRQAGVPFNGFKQMTFSLWSDQFSTLNGNRLGLPMTFPYVEIIDGKFTVDLEFTTTLTPVIFDGTERFLDITIADENGSNAVVVGPRQRLAATPHSSYAIKASAAKEAQHANSATSANYADSANTCYYASSADYASTAGSVAWSNITGIPAECTDGIDKTGGWNEVSSVSYTGNRIGINTSSPGTFNLAVSGTAAKTGGGTWSVFSDERLKHDITPMSGTLDRLMKLRGYSYEYNAEAVQNRLALPGRQIGLLAQEVETVFPDWVDRDSEGYRYVTERATTALMVEALRDMRNEKDREIDALKARNEHLESLIKGRD